VFARGGEKMLINPRLIIAGHAVNDICLEIENNRLKMSEFIVIFVSIYPYLRTPVLMNYMRFYISIVASIIFIAGILGSCKKKDEAEGIDKQLLDMAQSSSGYTWYKNDASLLDKSPGSGHNYPFLRTRFDQIASTMLDSNGKITDSITFPEGSFIVKELYSDGSTLARYAILYKQSNSSYADAKGWIWGYINADGTVAVTAEEKGQQCISCHSQDGNIDYMLMNKYFP